MAVTGKKILYQGIPGAFSHIAGLTFFGKGNTFAGVPSFFDIFKQVESMNAEYGMVPVENSLAGSVVENYDLLYDQNVTVIAEYYQEIRHHLLTPVLGDQSADERFKKIRSVLSHPKALEQCTRFFREHTHLKPTVYSDTAEAARHVAEQGDPSLAAVASSEASSLYGLHILRNDIHDNPHNWTRFLVITRRHREPDILEHDAIHKCSLIFTLPHSPGSLYTALGVFANAHLNLSKIESRPIPGTNFEYVFYVDIEFHSHDYARVRDLVQEFSNFIREVKVLGYYRKALIE
jgi:prephenate dehydratase